MFTPTRVLGALAFGLGLGLVASAEPYTAQMAVLTLADNLEQPDIARQAKKVAEQYGNCGQRISLVFHLKSKGGVGIGSAVQAGHQNSIEDLIQNWSGPRPPTQDELRAHRKDLLQAAQVVQAMAELAPYRVVHFNPRGIDRFQERFRQVTAEFQAAAGEFRQGIEAGKPNEVRKAAVNLQRSCNACHKGFNFR